MNRMHSTCPTRWLWISVLLPALVATLTACVAPAAPQRATTAAPVTGPQLRVEAVWSQPAILLAAPEPTPCMDLATAAQSINPCEADGNEMPICATPEAQPADAHVGHTQMAEAETATVGARGVVYLTILNEGAGADYLVGIQSPMAASVEIHQTTMDANGVMKMRHVEDKLEIPPGVQVDFAPAGYHIMLIDLQQDLKVGDRFPVTLLFEQSGAITVESEVRLPGE